MTADQIASAEPMLWALCEDFRDCFQREPTFQHFRAYLLGLLSDVKRKNVEAIALAADVPVRSLQEFLAQFRWRHERLNTRLQRRIVDEHGGEQAVGVIDESAHPKRGDKTPGVQHQYCGQSGKIDNCVVGVHLLYSDNHPTNPFSVMLDSALYLPRAWADDAARRREAGLPEPMGHRPKWLIAASLIESALGQGVRLAWLTFDEEYGKVPAFWFTLDAMGQRGVGEVPRNFACWSTPPKYRSLQRSFRPTTVERAARHSPAFTAQRWRTITVKDTTRGALRWQVKAAQVQLPDTSVSPSQPTDRRYWLIVARQPRTGEVKYLICNAAANVAVAAMLRAALARWHVEKWFERAKQETGFGDFEVRRYVGLIRHWLCCRLAMYFLATATQRLRGEKSADHIRADGPCRENAAGQTAQPLAAHVA